MRPVVIEQFPGLDLRTDPGDSSGAIDLMNVTLEPGSVRSRNGSLPLGVTFGSQQAVFLAPMEGGTRIAVVTAAGTLETLDTAGAVVGSTSTITVPGEGLSGVALGTSGTALFYICDGTTVKQWSSGGGAWTAPGGMPASTRVLTVMPTDNRLVCCDGTGLCKVSMSDPGAPTTFGANNFVLLTPGDGEKIQGAAVFNNQTFIFKKTKFYVFYGNSVDATGNPVFNYRTVNTGIGMHVADPQSVCVGPDGIYFFGRDGIYRTTGGPPQRISLALDPYFIVGSGVLSTSPFWLGDRISPGFSYRMTWAGGLLYVGMPSTNTSSGLFVYDPALNAWTMWSTIAWSMMALRTTSTTGFQDEALLVGLDTGGLRLFSRTQTSDNGTAIVSRYRMAFNAYGPEGQKKLRETLLEGTGTPTLQMSTDWGALEAGAAVTLGTSPALGRGRRARAFRGRRFSLQLGAASGAWQVRRVQLNFTDNTRGARVTA